MRPDWPLHTERLTLRPFEARDFAALHALYTDPDVVRHLYEGLQTEEQSRARLARKVSAVEVTSTYGIAAVAELSDGTFVGDLSLWWENEQHRTFEIGFVVVPDHQGRGYATEAARALLDWAFSVGAHRVVGQIEARNSASARVLEKLGMRKEAHFVENEWVKGEWQSGAVYAILEREWQR